MLRDQRGVALPMALLSLGLLLPLMLALASLSTHEPLIAGNLLQASQGRTLADSGLQYALWALSAPGGLPSPLPASPAPGGLPSPLPASPAPAPFDGRTLTAVGMTGGFTVQVVDHAGGDPQLRTIAAVGWVAGSGTGAARAHRQVIADVVAIPHPGLRAPCALCGRGGLSLTGNIAVDGGAGDATCAGSRHGAVSSGPVNVVGPVALSGSAGGAASHQPAGALDAVVLSPAALDALRTLAARAGTYYGPGFPAGGLVSDGGAAWAGRIVFDAARPLQDGIVFIDTTDGRAPPPGGGTLAAARLDAGAVAAPDGVFRGWIIVNGRLEITAPVHLRGLVHVADTLTYRAPGQGSLEGLVVALGAQQPAVWLEALAGGALSLAFDCRHAGGAGAVPHGFALVPGTYREERD